MNVWCVKWSRRDDTGKTVEQGWCATFRNAKPSPDANSDRTACGMYVCMRGDSAKRMPTCEDCKPVVARRRSHRRIA